MISRVKRGITIFNHTAKTGKSNLLNIGCGPYSRPEFINLDYLWEPGIDVCWDIAKKCYPFANSSLEGIFTEHCLEHIEMKEALANFKEFFRMLKPGCIARIVVPDCELYIDIYEMRKRGSKVRMPYEDGYITPMARINGIFRNHGHKFIYDFDTIKNLLNQAGFSKITKHSFGEGNDKRLLVEQEWRAVESLYVEAQR